MYNMAVFLHLNKVKQNKHDTHTKKKNLKIIHIIKNMKIKTHRYIKNKMAICNNNATVTKELLKETNESANKITIK